MQVEHTFVVISEKKAVWILGSDHVEGALEEWMAAHGQAAFRGADFLWCKVDSVSQIFGGLVATARREKGLASHILVSVGGQDLIDMGNRRLRSQFEKMIEKSVAFIGKSGKRSSTVANLIISPVQANFYYPTYKKQSAARQKLLGINRKINALAAKHACIVTPPTGIQSGNQDHFDNKQCKTLSKRGHELLAHSWFIALESNCI